MAINVPTTHIINDNPTLPDNWRIVLGVAKIPVPITRLKIKNDALTTPIWRRLSGVASKTFPSSAHVSFKLIPGGGKWRHTKLRNTISPTRRLINGLRVRDNALLEI